MIITSAEEINGVYTALFTPLKNDDPKCLNNSIDYKKAEKIIDNLIAQGIHGIVPSGTTGQSATMSNEQHLEFIRFVTEYVAGKIPVIAGAGSNCTRESVEMINNIQKISQIPVLCVTGYYNNPTQDGILKHYETLASETDAKIIMYNVPCRTLSYIDPDTTIELANNKNIIGMKQAVDFKLGGSHHGDTLKIAEGTKDKDFALISGEDDSFYDMLDMGGSAIISATANIPEAAALYIALKEQFDSGDSKKARETQKTLETFVKMCFCLKNPIPLGTCFNSPLYQPLSSVIDTLDGKKLHEVIMETIKEHAPSLLTYHN